MNENETKKREPINFTSSRLILGVLRFFGQVIGHGPTIPVSGFWFGWFSCRFLPQIGLWRHPACWFLRHKKFSNWISDYSRTGCHFGQISSNSTSLPDFLRLYYRTLFKCKRCLIRNCVATVFAGGNTWNNLCHGNAFDINNFFIQDAFFQEAFFEHLSMVWWQVFLEGVDEIWK